MANKLILRKQKSPYTGNFADTTKSKTLSISELDNNQIYLKGLNIITGSTSGTDIILDKLNGDQITIDASSIAASTDYGNIIFVSESGTLSGVTRNDVIGDITNPVSLELATQLAQSGDTIHVKSGMYTITTAASTGLSVKGVDFYFEPNANVYRSTSGIFFSMDNSNVYGRGSFYGSGSSGPIFLFDQADNISGQTIVAEWDEAVNTSNSVAQGTVYGDSHVVLKGLSKAISTTSTCVFINTEDSTAIYDCPIFKSDNTTAIYAGAGAGKSKNIIINSNDISSSGNSLQIQEFVEGHSVVVNSTYIENVLVNPTSGHTNVTINGGRVDYISFIGDYLEVNAHVGHYNHTSGIANLSLVDRCWGAGTGVVNATLNGDFDYMSDSLANPLVSSFAGNIILNYKLQKKDVTPGPVQYDFVDGWFMSNGAGTMNMLGNWDIQNFWISQSGGRINIPNGTVINIGPNNPSGTAGFGVTGETFNFAGVDFNVSGTIVERCDPSAPCDTSQSAITYSNTLMYVKDWGYGNLPSTSTRVVYNGATIILRDQYSQIITTDVSGGTVSVYSGGLNTNKIGSFQAENEKIRVSVSGTSASYTVNGETFTCTTGTTAAECAAELVSLSNASGTLDATLTQDTPTVDEYFYIESDIAGEPLTLTYGAATALDVIIRHNTKAITEIVGGTIIESANIIKDQDN